MVTDNKSKKDSKAKSPHAGHRQRVITKYIKHGLSSFSEHEVLELLLFFSVPRRDTNELAHTILDQFGSLENVLNAAPEDLELVSGVGAHSATLISLFRAVYEYKNTVLYDKRTRFRDIGQLGMFCIKYFSQHVNESVILLSLDSKGTLKNLSVISEGTVNQSPFYPAKIIKIALNVNAASIVIAHNHPGGEISPSSADVILSKKLDALCESVNIEFLDHIICNEMFFTSMRERGLFDARLS